MLCFFFFLLLFFLLLPSPLFKQYLKIFWACMFDLIYSFYWTKQLLYRQEFGQVRDQFNPSLFYSSPSFSTTSLLFLDCGAIMTWRSRTSVLTHGLVSAAHGRHFHATTWHSNPAPHGHISGGRFACLFSVLLYVHPKRSSTSDCRKLHGHFNTVSFFFFFFLLLIKYRERKV